MFITPDDFPVPAGLRETDAQHSRQSSFRRRVGRERLRATFDSPPGLALHVVEAIRNWEQSEIQRARSGDLRAVTKLLFPFVTNQGGFDTGLAISNTSCDPFGTPGQAGTCTLFYYGTVQGGAASPVPQTSVVVASGRQIVWTLSGGNRPAGLNGTPGFQGYIIAVCGFPAHGFAFMNDGFGGVPQVASGYLATRITDRQPAL